MRLKRLELWWRGLWIRLLVKLMRRAGDGRPQWDTRPVRVLFLRHDRAGDMILSTGLMRAIARSHATITLDVLASPANAAVLDGADYVSRVIVFNKKDLTSYVPVALALRHAKYDAVIDCMVTAPSVTTLLLILASGARYRVGISGRGNDAAFNVTVPGETGPAAHMVDFLAALAPAFDVTLDENQRRPIITLSERERANADSRWTPAGPRRALINISAGSAERLWPDESYAAVMRHLSELEPGVSMVVIGAPSDSDRASAIADSGGGIAVPTPSIRDAFALVATADFVFTPDTSIAHAASAFQRPCVAIYADNKSERWGLYRTVGENVLNDDSSLASLTVHRVLPAIDRVWGQAGWRSD
ncbi:MAG: glycosyltransferase family 9 protein [Gemmatimonadaceae bacterium]